MKRRFLPLIALALLGVGACRTIGITRANGYGDISPAVAHQMMLDSSQVVVMDFRPSDIYNAEQGHIAGAISVPLDTIENQLPELLPYSSSTILVYASTDEESERGAKVLVAAGFRNIIIIRGGLERWIELGYKTVTSA
jgi:phage shock protein E